MEATLREQTGAALHFSKGLFALAVNALAVNALHGLCDSTHLDSSVAVQVDHKAIRGNSCCTETCGCCVVLCVCACVRVCVCVCVCVSIVHTHKSAFVHMCTSVMHMFLRVIMVSFVDRDKQGCEKLSPATQHQSRPTSAM